MVMSLLAASSKNKKNSNLSKSLKQTTSATTSISLLIQVIQSQAVVVAAHQTVKMMTVSKTLTLTQAKNQRPLMSMIKIQCQNQRTIVISCKGTQIK